jgi:hypothetical protein
MGRLLPLLFVLAAPSAAQPPPPETFYPLGVGDVWEYAEPATGNILRVHNARDTTITGRVYVIQERVKFDAAGTPIPQMPPFYRLRYDTLSTHVVEPYTDGSGTEVPSQPAPCPFGGGSVVSCDGVMATVHTFRGTLTVGDTVLTGVWFKEYASELFLLTYATGIGEAEKWSKVSPYRYLAYARVAGVEYGTPRFPVAAEPGPPEVLAALALSVWPNPARGQATVAFTLASPALVRAAVYDGLGREVLTRDLGMLPVGQHEAALDLSHLAPGLYAVRVAAGGASGTVRFVRSGSSN